MLLTTIINSPLSFTTFDAEVHDHHLHHVFRIII
jgi:hypothetical protein